MNVLISQKLIIDVELSELIRMRRDLIIDDHVIVKKW